MIRAALLGVCALLAGTSLAAQGAPLFVLNDTLLFPEGISRDAARSRWLVSSVHRRTVVAIDDAGQLSPFARALPDDVGAILGVRVDASRGALFATAAPLPPMRGYAGAESARAELLEFALADGSLRRRTPLGRAPGDLAIAGDGTVYVTDGLAGVLFVVPANGGPVVERRSAFFASLQGLVLTAEGDALLAADYRHGLLRIPLDPRDTVTQILDAEGRRAQGLDALAWHGRTLIATYNGRAPGRVVRITLSPDQRRIADFTVLETHEGPGEPTLGVVLDDTFIYIANSPWAAFDDNGARRPEVPIAKPELRRLPLTPPER
ncbi:MAG: hypothetical protein IT357_09850 [Gemmatimonadaceae bacterium]|nr:hypothetical protein [Gemmatimonadaceae bacterium]